jgi:DNA-binding IclR family transcriptional regulator
VSGVPGDVRTLHVLETLAASGEGLSAAGCAAATGIPRASCHRLLQALAAEGYVQRLGRDRYALGWRTLLFAQRLAERPPLAGAREALEELVARTGQTAHLGVLDGTVAVYLACVDSPRSLRLAARPGSRIPINVSAIGMALAAWLPAGEREALVRGHSWPSRTPLSLTGPDELLAALEATRARGYALDDRGYALDVRCVAAPVFGSSGRAVAAVGITSLASELSLDDEGVVGAVRAAAQRLEADLRGKGGGAASEVPGVPARSL